MRNNLMLETIRQAIDRLIADVQEEQKRDPGREDYAQTIFHLQMARDAHGRKPLVSPKPDEPDSTMPGSHIAPND